MDYLYDHWVLAGKTLQGYEQLSYSEPFVVSIEMKKTLRFLTGKFKTRALDVLALVGLTEAQIHTS
eukprot:5397893-Amphidinium_carterae.1